MTEGIIRSAKDEDLECILQLLYQLSPKKENETCDPEKLFEILRDPDCYLKVYEERAVLGTGMLLVMSNLSHGARPIGYIGNVVVDHTARRKGIATKLVNNLAETARSRNCYKAILNCEKHNIAFYESCGFHQTGEVEMRFDFK